MDTREFSSLLIAKQRKRVLMSMNIRIFLVYSAMVLHEYVYACAYISVIISYYVIELFRLQIAIQLCVLLTALRVGLSMSYMSFTQ